MKKKGFVRCLSAYSPHFDGLSFPRYRLWRPSGGKRIFPGLGTVYEHRHLCGFRTVRRDRAHDSPVFPGLIHPAHPDDKRPASFLRAVHVKAIQKGGKKKALYDIFPD